jgi:hypothetical protein
MLSGFFANGVMLRRGFSALVALVMGLSGVAWAGVGAVSIYNIQQGSGYPANAQFPYRITCGATVTNFTLGANETRTINNVAENTVCEVLLLDGRPGLLPNHIYNPAPTLGYGGRGTSPSACPSLPSGALVCQPRW